MTGQLSHDPQYVLTVLKQSPIPLSAIDVRLVRALVDGPPEHSEQVIDELVRAHELRDSPLPGVWIVTDPHTAGQDESVQPRLPTRRGLDPQEVLLGWLVGVVVEADHEVSPLSWRLTKPTGPTWPFGGRKGALLWWDQHRAQMLRLLDLLHQRGLWRLSWMAAEAVWGLAQATHYPSAQVTSQHFGLAAIDQEHHRAVDQEGDRAGYLLRRAVFTIRTAFALTDEGNLIAALRWADLAVDRAREAGDPLVLAAALSTRARVVTAVGDPERFDAAIRDLHQALDLDEAHDDHRGQGLRRRRLGELLVAAGRSREGLAELERASELFGQVGDVVGRAVVLDRIGHELVAAGRPGEAFEPLREALKTLITVGTPGQIGHAYHGLGLAAMATGVRESARAYLTRAVPLYRDGDRVRDADTVQRVLDHQFANHA